MRIGTIMLIVVMVILGGLIGFGVEFLTAPRSGKATRAMLRSKGLRIQEKVAEDINLAAAPVRNQLENITNGAHDRVVGIGGQLKETVSSISLPFSARGR